MILVAQLATMLRWRQRAQVAFVNLQIRKFLTKLSFGFLLNHAIRAVADLYTFKGLVLIPVLWWIPTSHIAIVIRPTTGNVERVREIYSPDFFVDRDMLGLVQLKSKMNMRSSESRTVYVAQALTVKADAWKEGGEVSFVTEGHSVPGQDKPQKYGLNCHIGSHVDAKVVNAGLDGYAWPLDCTRLNGDAVKGYYIEALGFFLTTHEDSKDFGVSDTTVDNVTIER